MKKYQQITPVARVEAEVLIRQGTPKDIGLTLVRLAYHDSDWRWVQDLCIELSTHKDKWVRRNCATCLGHLARIHGQLEKEKVMLVLNRLLRDPEVKGEAEDAIEDLKVSLKRA